MAARTGGPVLELGCGTGRVAARLVAAGIPVVGVDLDVEMLRVARRRGVRSAVAADMRRLAFGRRFPAVVVPYNALQLLLDDADLAACLRSAAAHLEGDAGRVAFEVTDFLHGALRDEVGPEILSCAPGCTVIGTLRHDRVRRVSRYERRFVLADGGEHAEVTVLRSFRPGELERFLADAGLAVEHVERDGPRARCVARATRRPDPGAAASVAG